VALKGEGKRSSWRFRFIDGNKDPKPATWSISSSPGWG
jgi:hypothetical protein